MKPPCPNCKGSGSLYTMIAGDKHIAECPECEGFGVREPVKKIKASSTYGKFGSINLDDLIDDVNLGR